MLLYLWNAVVNCKIVKDAGFNLSTYLSKMTGYLTKFMETLVDIRDYIIGDMTLVCNDCNQPFSANGTKIVHEENCPAVNCF